MVGIEELIIPFVVPAVTGLIIFISQWHKKGSQIEISGADIIDMKKKTEDIESKIDKVIEKINTLTTDTEIFRYRLKVLERTMDEYGGWHGSSKQPFRPKDSNGE